MVLQCTTTSESATMDLAAGLAPCLRSGTLITLSGPLGAGKTAFVRGLARGLGVNPADVSSPTFVICHEYEPSGNHSLRLAHIDLYRVSGADELDTIGWDELLASPDTVVAVEWPERVEEMLANLDRVAVMLEHAGETSRRITIDASPRLAAMLDPCLKRIANERQRRISCAICGRDVAPDAKAFPFCSERCRLVDLGRWFGGAYTISRGLKEDDFEQ